MPQSQEPDTEPRDYDAIVAQLNAGSKGHLPGLVGLHVTGAGHGWLEMELSVRQELMAPNGFLHAATVIALADSACGYGCITAIPKGAAGFTTIELKSNFTGTAREGVIETRAEAQHLGRTTQLWDAVVTHRQTEKVIAHFRCTQMVLWPR